MINLRFFSFEWDANKDAENFDKHGVDFEIAKLAFLDEHRVLMEDPKHSIYELRYFCIGKVGDGILTVRFTSRQNVIRIIGAGYWRRGRRIYHEKKESRG